MAELEKLEAALGHRFTDRTLLVRSLTHSSLAYESVGHGAQAAQTNGTHEEIEDNEQLEFLGDAVVGLLTAESLYRAFPALEEGELTRLRAHLVSRKHLAAVGADLGLGEYLRLGRGEERSGGRKKTVLLANSMEAVIGAIYLDAGLEKVRELVERVVIHPFAGDLARQLREEGVLADHKSALQEHLQSLRSGRPEYVVKGESGPDHHKMFLVEVRLKPTGDQRARVLARGIGSTKKKAEQEAARRAYQKLRRSAAPEENGTAKKDATARKEAPASHAGRAASAAGAKVESR